MNLKWISIVLATKLRIWMWFRPFWRHNYKNSPLKTIFRQLRFWLKSMPLNTWHDRNFPPLAARLTLIQNSAFGKILNQTTKLVQYWRFGARKQKFNRFCTIFVRKFFLQLPFRLSVFPRYNLKRNLKKKLKLWTKIYWKSIILARFQPIFRQFSWWIFSSTRHDGQTSHQLNAQ